MFSCAYDHGLAMFLAEQAATADGTRPGALEWACAAATLVFAGMAVVIPA